MVGSNSRVVIALVLSSAHCAQHFFSRLVPPLIPLLAVELSLPLWKLGLLISVYSVASGFGEAPFGVLSDKYDRRYILPPGIGILAVGYLIFGFAPQIGAILPEIRLVGYTFTGSYLIMCLAMFVAGVGASVTHPTGYPLISENIDKNWKGRALGMWGSASKAGDATAPALIGVMILIFAWNDILLILGTVGVIYALFLFAILGRDEYETRPPDHISNHDGTKKGSQDSQTNIWSDDKRLFVYPMFVILIFFITRTVATKGVNTFVPAFIVDTYGYSFDYFGLSLAPESFANMYFSALLFTAAIVQLFTGLVTDAYDARKVLLAFLGVSTVSLAVLSFVRLSPLLLFAVLLVVGGGLWGLNPARDALVSNISPPEREGRTFGYLWTLTQVIGAAAPIFIGFIADMTSIQDSFKYLALATLFSAMVLGLLFSNQIYRETDD